MAVRAKAEGRSSHVSTVRANQVEWGARALSPSSGPRGARVRHRHKDDEHFAAVRTVDGDVDRVRSHSVQLSMKRKLAVNAAQSRIHGSTTAPAKAIAKAVVA